MSPALTRRAVLAASLAAATAAASLVTTASAATFSGTITSSPAPDSGGFVQANRPTFTATFTAPLASSSTITVKDGSTVVDCPPVVNGSAVSCVPTADLVNGKTYAVSAHGVAASNSATTADAGPTNFNDAHPTLASSYPSKDGSIISGSRTLTAKYTNAESGVGISTDPTKSTFTVYDFINGERGNAISGAVTYTQSDNTPGIGSPTDTINFQGTFAPGEYEAVIHVDGDDGSGHDNPAAYDDQDIVFWATNAPPGNLAAPPIINNTNDTAAAFTGTAAPGLTITVTVSGTHTISPAPPQPSSASGMAVVPPCGDAAPDCPWTVKVDVSNLDDGQLTWNAFGKDNDPKGPNSTPTSNGPPVKKDVTPPGAPTVTAPSPAAGSNTLVVSATDSATDVTSYTITITDQDGNKLGPQTFPATNNNLPNTNITMDGLDDGQLTVVVTANDTSGNVSAPASPASKPVKNVGLKPDLTLSTVTVAGSPILLVDAATHPIKSPSQIALHFTEPVIDHWQDNSNSAQGKARRTPRRSACATCTATVSTAA